MTKLACFCIMFAMITSTGCDNKDIVEEQTTIKIAVMYPFRIYSALGEMYRQTAELAIQEINEDGGLRVGGLDVNLELVFVDDEQDAATGIELAGQLKSEGVSIIVGPGISGVTLGEDHAYSADKIDGVADFAILNEMLMVSFSATASAIGDLDDNDLVYRTCPSDAFQGAIGAAYVHDTLAFLDAAIIHRNDTWGRGLAEAFTINYESLGGTVVKNVSYPIYEDYTAYDFSPQLEELAGATVDVIYLLHFGNDGAKLTQDIASHPVLSGDLPPLFASEGSFDATLLESGHVDVLLGMRGTFPAEATGNENSDRFIAAFSSKYNIDPYGYASFLYDAIYLVAYAVQAAGSAEAMQAKEQVRAVSTSDPGDVVIGVGEFTRAKKSILDGSKIDYDGASGKIELDEKGDPGSGTYLIWEIVEEGSVLTFQNIQQVEYP